MNCVELNAEVNVKIASISLVISIEHCLVV